MNKIGFMCRKLTLKGMAILVFISSRLGVRRSSGKARLKDCDEVDAYIGTKMNELGIPGADLVIVEGDRIVHLKAFGVASGSGRPVTSQRRFFTGSTGKSLTALAIMQLVEAGKIKLDASVQTYPGFGSQMSMHQKRSLSASFLTRPVGFPNPSGKSSWQIPTRVTQRSRITFEH